MKKYFLTGLAILLPIVLTFFILSLLVNIITKPFIGLTTYTFDYNDLFNQPFFIFDGETVLSVVSKLIVLVSLFVIIIFIGFVGELFLIRWLRHLGDFIIHRIPVINRVYKSTRDVVHTLLVRKDTGEETNFSGVVLIPFPHKNTYSIGLITNREHGKSDDEYLEYVSVFVPGTPNPTMGFMLLFKEEQIIPLNMKVDEAIKFCVSCGVIAPRTISHHPEELLEDIAVT